LTEPKLRSFGQILNSRFAQRKKRKVMRRPCTTFADLVAARFATLAAFSYSPSLGRDFFARTCRKFPFGSYLPGYLSAIEAWEISILGRVPCRFGNSKHISALHG
jgi:hypothetical protein